MKTSVKYPTEGRGCFGVAMRKKLDGTMEGVKCTPYNYTGKTVRSIPDFQKDHEEMRDKDAEGEIPTKTGRVSIWKGGYPGRAQNPKEYDIFGDDRWKDEVLKAISNTKCSVKDMIDHIISESKKVYEGTPQEHTFFIYHDHLSIMWEKTAIKYMKDIGWYDRFIKICGLNNAKVKKYYHFSVVGDSPELCRGLDSYGFSDLEVSIKFHVAVTSALARDDPKKFQVGTPKHVWSCMLRCWESCEPTSERIVQDIQGLTGVLHKIIENQGCVISGDNLRSGHRAERHDGKGQLSSRLRKNQRKDSQNERPLHPDAQDAYNDLVHFEDVGLDLDPDI